MNKIILFLTVLVLILSCSKNKNDDGKILKVSSNGRYLEKSDGTPFLYLGCTAWELFHKLTREEAEEYLKNRAGKGFTVIQAVVLAELDGLRIPNAYGEIPLTDFDPTKPNEKYFEHVDYVINKAEELGLFVALLPTWGDKMPDDHPTFGPIVFNEQNAKVYGEFLGKRYKEKPIIWMLGGDRNITADSIFNIWKSMAEGIKKGDEGRNLISYHPRGPHSSSEWFHNENWIDFNSYQSGHYKRYNEVYEMAQRDYLLQPIKPTIDIEPAYEDIAIRFWEFCDWNSPTGAFTKIVDTATNLIKDTAIFKLGFFTDYDVRVHGYWNLLSGSAGYTYGNNAIWQMFRKKGMIGVPCLYDWKQSLDRPGTFSIKPMRLLFDTRSIGKLVPDQSAIYGVNRKDSTHIRAAVASDGSYIIAYMAIGQPVRIVMNKIKGPKVKAWWFNTKSSEATLIGEYENAGFQIFTPPTSGIGNDWILVLDDIKIYDKEPGK